MTTPKKTKVTPVEPKDEQATLAVTGNGADLRPITLQDGVALLPVKEQQAKLAEYDARRNCFREWLLSHFIEGVHYGVPPGCEPKPSNPRQWQAKPSLYKAGALLIVDLLKLRAKFTADKEAWEQMGSREGTFVMRCELLHPTTDRIIGEGRGVFAIGEKKMPPNSSIKMCEKRSLIDAVLNGIPVCGDLFSQDLEEIGPNPNPKPNADPMQPQAPTRSERTPQAAGTTTTEGENEKGDAFPTDLYEQVVKAYQKKYPGNDGTAFRQWCTDQIGVSMDVRSNWTAERAQTCLEVLKQ